MTLKGIGNDIIEIRRIQKSMERFGTYFLSRLFTQKEQKYWLCFKNPAPHFAARFAAKEAIVKALGVGIGKTISWHDIEIFNDKKGKPKVLFSSRAASLFDHPQILLSMSHSQDYATAVAIWTCY